MVGVRREADTISLVGGVGRRAAAGGGGASIVSRISGGIDPRIGTTGAR